ncbi:MAG TPA: hypothetical protein VEA63_00750, partial [Opitutus sp.]|nr:hypothetical protein [Opitutus sp.]
CTIEAGDDAIAFSPCADGFGSGVAENITVTNCVLHARSAAIRIGWGQHDFRNLLFSNIVIRDSNRGILIQLRQGERVENVVFSNIVIETRLYRGKWWGKGEPIHISALAERADETRQRTLRNVSFNNVTATGDHGVVLYADDRSTLEDITFSGVRLRVVPSPLQVSFGGNFDLRPHWDPSYQVFRHDIAAVFASGVKGLRLRDVTVTWAEGLPDFFRHAVEIERFTDVTIDDFRGRQAQVERSDHDAAIVLRDGCDAVVRRAKLASGGRHLTAIAGVRDLTIEPSLSCSSR